MNLIYEILLAVSLCIDSMALAFLVGVSNKEIEKHHHHGLNMAIMFAVVQVVMFVLGHYVHSFVGGYLSSMDFVGDLLFLFLGVKILSDTFKSEEKESFVISFTALMMLAITSSIDAAIAGFAFRSSEPIRVFVIIFICTVVLSILAFYKFFVLKNFPEKILLRLAGSFFMVLGLADILMR